MDLLRERLKARGALCAVLRGGGGGSSSTETTGATTETTNVDQRMAIQDGVGTNGDGNTVTYNSSDAVVAIANAGADVIKSSGGAVVDLYKDAGKRNSDAWNATLSESGKLVDKLIDQASAGFGLSEKVVNAFTPTENKNADIGKYAMIAAAAVAAAVLLKGNK